MHMHGGEKITTGALILATGAKWRQLGIPGEKREHRPRRRPSVRTVTAPSTRTNRSPLSAAVTQGLKRQSIWQGSVSHVTLVEFGPKLNADEVLIKKLQSLGNARIITSGAARHILDDGAKVTGLAILHRESEASENISVDGIFVQIGLDPNSAPFAELVSLNPRGEIEVDGHCRTGLTGIYAAGDVTDVPYKQIIVAMGEGAKAGLSTFEDFARGHIEQLPK